jgi:hypothetical protein
MRKDLSVDLFDAWLLGGTGGIRGRVMPIWPSLPLLSQSWSLLDPLGASVPRCPRS